jgi:hypothetical protein
LKGWIPLQDLMKVPLLSEYTVNEVLGEVQTSYSYRKTPRYQWEKRPDGVYVRAAYGRKFERVYFIKFFNSNFINILFYFRIHFMNKLKYVVY